MPEYRRTKIAGGTFFFTVVTFNRKPFLISDTARNLLHSAWVATQQRFPFITEAICLLPDHLHCIWRLPEDEIDYSVRWKEIKRRFTKRYLEQIGPGEPPNESRLKRHEAAVWQRRFWEHTIRDQADLNAHLDYIHFNPVKHGLVERVSDWSWSSFHRYMQSGYYPMDWGEGAGQEVTIRDSGE